MDDSTKRNGTQKRIMTIEQMDCCIGSALIHNELSFLPLEIQTECR